MTRVARVTRIFTKGYAEVAVQGDGRTCDHKCAGCPSKGEDCMVLTPDDERYVAENYEKAEVKDLVLLKDAQPREEKIANVAYVMPVLMGVFGYFLARGQGMGLTDRLLTALILALLTLLIVWIMNRRARMRRVMKFEVVKVLKKHKKDD